MIVEVVVAVVAVVVIRLTVDTLVSEHYESCDFNTTWIVNSLKVHFFISPPCPLSGPRSRHLFSSAWIRLAVPSLSLPCHCQLINHNHKSTPQGQHHNNTMETARQHVSYFFFLVFFIIFLYYINVYFRLTTILRMGINEVWDAIRLEPLGTFFPYYIFLTILILIYNK